MQISSFSRTMSKKTFLFPLHHPEILVKNNQTIYVRVYFWARYSILLVYMSVFCQYYIVLITIALQKILKSESVSLTGLIFFKIFPAIWDSLRSQMNFRMGFSTYANNIIEILIGIPLNLYTALDCMGISTILTLPSHENGMLFHLFMYFFISFSKILKFSLYQPFSYLVNLVTKYYIIFDAT